MNKLIIGSHAAKHYFSDFRFPNDTDYINKDSSEVTKTVQNYWIPEFQFILDNNKDPKFIDADFLFTLKSSHFGWDIHWQKTAADILFLKSKGCRLHKELYKSLAEGWKRVHGEKWAKLKDKKAGEFFADNVIRKYVHDDIHEAIAVYDEPLYYRMLERRDSVKCLESKFNEIPFEDQILLVKEEVWVTALERYLIPSDFTDSPKSAYGKSLKKLITTMSGGGAKGWFKLFMIDNYDKLYKNEDESYIERFKNAEKQSKVRFEQNYEKTN